jgi:hypothetical protein
MQLRKLGFLRQVKEQYFNDDNENWKSVVTALKLISAVAVY